MNIQEIIAQSSYTVLSLEEQQKLCSSNTLSQLLYEGRQQGDYQLFFQELAKEYNIEEIHSKVKDYIVYTEGVDLLKGPARLLGAAFACAEYYSFKEDYLQGIPLWRIDPETHLCLQTAAVFRLSAYDFEDLAYEVSTSTASREEFWEDFVHLGAVFDIKAYMHLNFILAQQDYGMIWTSASLKDNRALLRAVKFVQQYGVAELENLVFNNYAGNFIHDAALMYVELIEKKEITTKEFLKI